MLAVWGERRNINIVDVIYTYCSDAADNELLNEVTDLVDKALELSKHPQVNTKTVANTANTVSKVATSPILAAVAKAQQSAAEEGEEGQEVEKLLKSTSLASSTPGSPPSGMTSLPGSPPPGSERSGTNPLSSPGSVRRGINSPPINLDTIHKLQETAYAKYYKIQSSEIKDKALEKIKILEETAKLEALPINPVERKLSFGNVSQGKAEGEPLSLNLAWNKFKTEAGISGYTNANQRRYDNHKTRRNSKSRKARNPTRKL